MFQALLQGICVQAFDTTFPPSYTVQPFCGKAPSVIIAYCFLKKKPAIDVNTIKDRQLTLFLSYIGLMLNIILSGYNKS